MVGNPCSDRTRRHGREAQLRDARVASWEDPAPGAADLPGLGRDARLLRSGLDELDESARRSMILAHDEGLTLAGASAARERRPAR
jgi:DNA-directed RNA polymerase specialized sigma24 family protein